MFGKFIHNMIKRGTKNLSPEEKAQYVLSEWQRIRDDAAKGKDVSKDVAYLKWFGEVQGRSMRPVDLVKYIAELHRLEIQRAAQMYFTVVLEGLNRDEALIDLTLKALMMNHQFISRKVDLAKYGQTDITSLENTMQSILDTRSKMRTACDNILKDPLWDFYGIQRPHIPQPGGDSASIVQEV